MVRGDSRALQSKVVQGLLNDSDGVGPAMHPVDEKYESLGVKLELVQPKSEEFEMISTYCSQTMRGNSVQLQVRANLYLMQLAMRCVRTNNISTASDAPPLADPASPRAERLEREQRQGGPCVHALQDNGQSQAALAWHKRGRGRCHSKRRPAHHASQRCVQIACLAHNNAHVTSTWPTLTLLL